MTSMSSKTKTVLMTVGIVVLIGATVVWTWSIVSHERRGVVPPEVSTPHSATAPSPAKKRRRRRRSQNNSKLTTVGRSNSSGTSSEKSTGSSTTTSTTLSGTENSSGSNYSLTFTYPVPSSNTTQSDLRTAVAAPSTTTQPAALNVGVLSPSIKVEQVVQTVLANSFAGAKLTTGGRAERWSVRCASCRLVIDRNEALKGNVMFTLNRFWHRDHFTCTTCQVPLGSKKAEFRADRNAPNTPICLDCHMDAHHPPCTLCKKPLMERALKAFGSLFHKGCLVCTRCHCPFADGEYYLFKGKPYDVDCYHLKKYESLINLHVPIHSPAPSTISTDSTSSGSTTTNKSVVLTSEKLGDFSKMPIPMPGPLVVKSSSTTPIVKPEEKKTSDSKSA